MTAFGDRLRELRLEQKIGLRELARRVNISAPYVSNIEQGKFDPPSAEIVERLAAELGQDKEEFLLLAGRVDSELMTLAEKDVTKVKMVRKLTKFVDSILHISEESGFGGLEGIVEIMIGQMFQTPGAKVKKFDFSRSLYRAARKMAVEEDDFLPEEMDIRRRVGRFALDWMFALGQNRTLTENEQKKLMEELLEKHELTFEDITIQPEEEDNEEHNS